MEAKNCKKLIVLGIDGFDPNIAEYLMDNGGLPNFKKLKETGSFAKLKTVNPAISPVVWTAAACGKNPAKTDLFDFMKFDRKKMLPALSIIEESETASGQEYLPPVKTKTIWELVSEAGVFSSVIRWPVTFPAKDINGELLSGMGVPDVRGFMSGYCRYTNKPVEKGESGARIIHILIEGHQINAEVLGPKKTTGGGYILEPFTVSIRDDESAIFFIQDKEYSLKRQTWSDWIEIKFKRGFGKYTKAIFKIFAESFFPEFDLFMTSLQFDPADPSAGISFPHHFSKVINDEIGRYYTLGMPEEIKAVNDLNLSVAAFISQTNGIKREREKMFWRELDVLSHKDKGLLMIVFDEFDRQNHILYSEEVEKEKGNIRSIKDNITRIYRGKDLFLGKILDGIKPDTALIVMSDHGFEYFSKTVNLNNWLLENGYLYLKSRVAPKAARALYEDVDWSKTKAYSFGYVSININMMDREKYGIVQSFEKDALTKEISEKLRQLEDGGRQVVTSVQNKESLYHGQYLENIGDIIVGFRPPYRIDWQNPLGGFNEKTIMDNKRPWSADHIFDPKFVPGTFYANFEINTTEPSVFDIAPTISRLFGLKSSQEFDGTSLI